jgi:hypothetical protein
VFNWGELLEFKRGKYSHPRLGIARRRFVAEQTQSHQCWFSWSAGGDFEAVLNKSSLASGIRKHCGGGRLLHRISGGRYGYLSTS